MREQVCTYMCPWPRIQAAMLDEYSLTVTYNDWRGEPRSKHAKKMAAEGKPVGDCVDCNACVAVCPMGIDIRDGQQLECITCALCIDACDGVMDKLGKERGLISYATLNDYNAEHGAGGLSAGNNRSVACARQGRAACGQASATPPGARSCVPHRHLFRRLGADRAGHALFAGRSAPRSTSTCCTTATRSTSSSADGEIRNGYDVKILNMTPEPRTIRISLHDLPTGEMLLSAKDEPTSELIFDVEPDKLKTVKVFVKAEPKALGRHVERNFAFVAQDVMGTEHVRYEAKFETGERK